jgi:putative colanic acid polymerase
MTDRTAGRNLAAVLTFAFVIFQHYQLFLVAKYPVTLGLLFGALLLVTSVRRLTLSRSLLLLTIVIVPTALVQIATPELSRPESSYIQTSLLFVLAALILGQTASPLRKSAVDGIGVGVFYALVVVVLLSLLQVVTGSRGSAAWFNPWRTHQYLYEYNPLLQFNPVPRAAAFYLEPSYAAFIVGSSVVALTLLNRHVRAAWVLGAVGLLAIRSATGLFLFAALILIAVLAGRWRGKLVVLTSIVAVVPLVGAYLVSRLTSASASGSSANYRLVGPLQILRDTLLYNPFGHPLGSLEVIVSRYGILNGAAVGSSLDNGFYVMVFYFGWIGLIAAVVMIGAAVFASLRSVARREIGSGLVWIWVTGSLLFSGGIMLPEFALMTWLVLQSRSQALRLDSSNEYRDASLALDHHRHLQR